MSAAAVLSHTAHAVAALVVVLVIARLGRVTARRLRQPEVIGEILAGLLAGPAAVAMLGTTAFRVVLPTAVVGTLKLVAEVGLVLFLVGLAHKLRLSGHRLPGRTTAAVVLGGLVPALVSGLLFACWVLLVEGPSVRGSAPLPAFLVMCAVALSITAVPVLARILADRGAGDSTEGRLSVTAAVVIDTVGWLLLSVAVGLASGKPDGFLRALLVLGGGALVALLVRWALRSGPASALSARRPRTTAAVVAVVALVVALSVERLGLTAVFGAVLVGLAVPTERTWGKVVAAVTRAGRALIPVFFVVTGLTVFASGLGVLPWGLVLVATALAVIGKGGGSYAGARLSGEPRTTAARVGVLMNTRGLTELIVLEVGRGAGILTAPVHVALVLMAVVTTAMTGPLLRLLDRAPAPDRPRRTGPVPG